MTASTLVRQLRERAGLSQQELAVRSGTSQPAIARLESGRSVPSLATLQRLAAAAGFVLDIRAAPRAAWDPVIERYGQGIDRTLLRRNLQLTVDQRIRALARLQAFHAEVERGVKAARRKGGGPRP
jgi:transcriptional regulator with XRE-family HTH domain